MATGLSANTDSTAPSDGKAGEVKQKKYNLNKAKSKGLVSSLGEIDLCVDFVVKKGVNFEGFQEHGDNLVKERTALYVQTTLKTTVQLISKVMFKRVDVSETCTGHIWDACKTRLCKCKTL